MCNICVHFHMVHTVLRWSDGSIMLCKLPVQGRPSYLELSKARA